MRISEYNREFSRRARLKGVKCKSCGYVTVTNRDICPECGADRLKVVELNPRGKIVSYTVVRYPPLEFKGQEPYVVAMVELEDGCKVVGQVTDCKIEDAKDGAAVEVIFKKIKNEDGIIHYGYKFIITSD